MALNHPTWVFLSGAASLEGAFLVQWILRVWWIMSLGWGAYWFSRQESLLGMLAVLNATIAFIGTAIVGRMALILKHFESQSASKSVEG